MRKICVGCGKRIPGPQDENQSGIWCILGDCRIVDFEGINRLRAKVLELEKNAEKEASS